MKLLWLKEIIGDAYTEDMDAAAQELLDRDEAVRQELSAGEARISQTHAEGDGVRRELEQAREDRNALLNVISGYALRVEARQKKAKSAEERHVKLQMEENALSARIHMLTEMEKLYEGYSKAVKLVMGEAGRGSLRGVHGPVAGLVHVPDAYTVAIEIALGAAMQNIVVEREEDGKAAISYLKRRDGGRCTFLPLSSIRPGEFRDAGVRGERGFVGMGDELVKFDPRYQRVFSNLLGRVVVTEDMDAAACQAIGKDFVARADFNAKNTRVKELEAQVGQLEEAAKGHAKQLEELKKSAGDNEELTRKIGELEQQNKADKAAYEKELATIRLTAAVDAELTAAGAKNNTAVRALLADYLKDAKIEDGKVVAKVNNESITLAAKIEAMKKDANTDFLFGSTGAKLTGWKPGDPDTGRKPGEGKKPSEMSYSELAAFLAENPDAKLE